MPDTTSDDTDSAASMVTSRRTVSGPRNLEIRVKDRTIQTDRSTKYIPLIA